MSTLTKQILEDMFKTIPSNPIVDFMIAQGFDPAKGGVLVLPLEFEDKFFTMFNLDLRPNYVIFSKIVQQPMLMMGPQHVLYGTPVSLESFNER